MERRRDRSPTAPLLHSVPDDAGATPDGGLRMNLPGSPEPPPMEVNGSAVLPRISDYVDHFAHTRPAATAVVCGDRRVSYSLLQQQVDACARSLLASGVNKGDRVAMLAPPMLEFWVIFLATVKIGAMWVGLNPRYSLRECDYVLSDATPGMLFAVRCPGTRDDESLVAALRRNRPELDIVVSGDAIDGTADYEDFIRRGDGCDATRLETAAAGVGTLDPCLIVYTSGSSGSPKGAVLTHYGLSFGATLQTTHFAVDEPSIVVAFPINHVAAVADTCATTLVRGGKIVFLARFDPVETIALTARERCTLIGGVPTMYQLQMSAPGFRSADLSGVELFLWGGAAMPVELIRRLSGYDARLITAYGMTETATHVTYTDPGADLDTLATTVGRPDPCCRIRIATSDGGTSSEANAGEIQLKADFLMAGYWKRPEATHKAFTDDGWFRTGDVGFFRDDGNLKLVGRLSDMFKSGGYNVYPREIESVLESHPSVAMAAVVAIADPVYQEVGAAFIKPVGGTTPVTGELERWCRERLANYKVPKTFRIVDELPLLPVGKVDKQKLRQVASEQASGA